MTVEKETFQICNVWLSEISRRWSMHATLNTLQSFSHLPRVHKANLTWLIDDTMMQQNSKGIAWLWNLPRLHQSSRMFSLIFPHSTQTREGWHVSRKFPAMILPLRMAPWPGHKLWRNIERICNSFQAQEVAIQNGVGGPEMHLGSDVSKIKWFGFCLVCFV